MTKKAREDTDTQGPTLIEAITWRFGFHTSSDNPDLYRHSKENELWQPWDPIRRTRSYLALADWWNDRDEDELLERCADRIQTAVDEAGKLEIPGPESQFEDVFESSNWMLDEQRERLLAEVSSGDN
jgi:TPP-dependent pyruvate/acetoin dehydrogenase alpha subunit